MFSPKKSEGRESLKKRNLRLEMLEKREMLSVTPLVEVTGAMVSIYRNNDKIVVVGEDSQQFYTGDIAEIEKLTIKSNDGLAKVISVDMDRGGVFNFADGLLIQCSTGSSLTNIVKLIGSNQDNTFLVENTQVTLNSLVVTATDVSSMVLQGGEANDTYSLVGLMVNTTIYDAEGVNHLDFSGYTSAQTQGVEVNLGTTSAQKVFADNVNRLTLATQLQNLTGSQYADILRGNSLANVIIGGAGNDEIHGGAGADTIYGGAGDDTIYADSGNNRVYAGTGDINRIYGGTGNDRIFGSAGNDRIEAGGGNNLIVGGGGNDILTASNGRNVIIGGEGEDIITTGEDESIVITGQTIYDDYTQAESLAALEAIYATWISSDSRSARITALRDGVGTGASVKLDATTVLNDGEANTVNGTAGKNWIFASELHDTLNGVSATDGKDVINEGGIPVDPDPDPDPDDYQTLEAFKNELAELLATGDATALMFTVSENGTLLVSVREGVVDKASNAALTAGTLYPVGSVYQLIVTAGVMKLVEAGKVSLDDSVMELLPDVFTEAAAGSNLEALTVRMLLNGSSGLTDSIFAAETAVPSRDEYISAFLAYLGTLKEAATTPGTRTQDGEAGFLLAELLIQTITEKSLKEYITEKFLDPAGITGFVWDAADVLAAKNNVAKTDASLAWANRPSAGGGVMATPEAVAKFLGIFTGATTATSDGTALLSQASLTAMAQNQLANYWKSSADETWNNAIAPGLGWNSVADPVFSALGVSAWMQTSRAGDYLTVNLVIPEYKLVLTACAVLNPEADSDVALTDTVQSLLTRTVIGMLAEKGVTIDFPDTITYAGDAAVLPENFATTYAGVYATYGDILSVDFSGNNLLVRVYSASGWTDEIVCQYREDADGNGYFVPADQVEGDQETRLVFAETDGKIYIVTTVIDTIYGIAEMSCVSHQKLNAMAWDAIWDNAGVEEGDREAAKDTWLDDRVEKVYALSGDYYSSDAQAQPRVKLNYSGSDMSSIIFVEHEGGYYAFQIVDENTAVPVLDLPGEFGKQLPTLVFTADTEFKLGNMAYQSVSDFQSLTVGSTMEPSLTADAPGYWLHAPATSTPDVQLAVDVPANGRVMIFNASFKLLYDSFEDDGRLPSTASGTISAYQVTYDAQQELYIYVTSKTGGEWSISRTAE